MFQSRKQENLGTQETIGKMNENTCVSPHKAQETRREIHLGCVHLSECHSPTISAPECAEDPL